MDTSEAAVHTVEAVEETKDQSEETDSPGDRQGEGLGIGQQRPWPVVECWGIPHECRHSHHMARISWTLEPYCRTPSSQ
jgi:hypothetical protein